MKKFYHGIIVILSFLLLSNLSAQQVDWLNSGGGGGQDGGSGIAVDEYGNNYSIGTVQTSTLYYPRWGTDTISAGKNQGYNGYIVKHDVKGIRKWTASFGGISTDVGADIEMMSDTTFVAIGTYRSSGVKFDTITAPNATNSDARLFVAKFDTSGKIIWLKTAKLGNAPWSLWNNYYNPTVAVNSSGDIVIGGVFRTSATFGTTTLTASGFNTEAFVAKYDVNGNLKWAKKIAGTSFGWSYGSRVAIDNSGNPYIAGTYSNSITIGTKSLTSKGSWDVYLAKLDTAGKVKWAQGLGSTGQDDAYGISVDKYNHLFLGGRFTRSLAIGTTSLKTNGPITNSADAFIAMFDTSGTVKWSRALGGYTGNYANLDYCYGLDTDNKGNAAINGRFGGSRAKFGKDTTGAGNTWRAIYTSLLDSSGKFIWTVSGTSTTYYYNQGNGIALDSSKNIYVTGMGDPPLVFNNKVWASGAGFRDAYILKIADCSEADTAEIYVGSATSACLGDSIKLWSNNNPRLEYRWLRNGYGLYLATDTTYKVHVSDNYSLAINDEGCLDTSKSIKIKINPLPTVSISNFPVTCTGQNDFTLTQGSPKGGIYKGIGVKNDTVFSPTTSSNGSFNIRYIYTDTNSCTDSTNKNIVVGGQNAYLFLSDTNFCANEAAYTLSGGIPTGGTFFGTGVYNGKFYPDSAGAGTHTIRYLYSDNGCNDTASQIVIVNTTPTVAFASLPDQCSASFSLNLSSYGTPSGGTFSGTAVIGSVFYPIISKSGTFNLGYIKSNGTCSDTAFSSIKVVDPVKATLAAISNVCVYQSTFTLTGGLPTGGSYYVNNVASTTFNPSSLGVGSHSVKYIVSNLCGPDTATRTVVVNAQPTVTLSSFSAVCSNSGLLTLSGGSPSGGTYFGNNISAGKFNPATAGSGTHTINYTYSDGNSCSDTASKTIVVNASPTVTFSALSDVCIDNGLVTLSGGSPTPGTYSGTGVSGTSFNPATAGVGTHTLTYKHTDGNSCSDSATQTIKVNALPTVSMSTLSPVCINQPSFTLSGGTPSGGTYSGTGVSSNSFSPGTAGVGTHNIVYTYTDGNSCTNKDSTNQVVNAQPTVTLSSFSAVCSNSGLLTLSGGSPSGGTYFGNNISAGKFNPATAGSGTHTINYTYSDGNSCSDTASKTIVVNASPTVTFSALSDVCIDNGLVTLSGGSPTPGTYSGTGVSGTSFNPATAGVGTHTLTYKHTDGNSCSDSATQTIKVNALPTVSMSTLSPVCINQPSFTLSGGTPSGGTYSGTGVSSNSFSPGTAGVGTHNIVYTYTDGNSCTNKDSTNQVVNAQPTVTLSSFSAVCSNSGLLTLSGGSPSGGTYFGNNISAGKFNPATAGSGTHTINYTYSDGNSCSDTASKTIVVNASPTVTFSALSDVCIDNGLVTLSGGSPTPGTYSGTGVSGTSFNPATAGVGTHTLTYKHTDGNSCSDSATQTIKVNALPTVSMSTLSPVCINQPSFTLSGGTPSGGTYSGTGVSSNSFSPGTAGVGTHNIVYTYTDGNSCTNKDSTNQVVNAQPTVTLSSFSAVCSNSGLLTLSGGSPSGGTYFGNNISAGKFNPATAGSGTHTINYTYSDGNSCSDTASKTIVVNASPTVTFSALSDVCIDNGLVTLSGGSPTPGTYSGTGVSGTSFNPATAGVGTHTLTYKHTDGNSCSDSATQTIKVNALPTVSMSTLSPVCINQPSFTLSGGTPSGGTYSGTGVSSNSFSPGTAGVGTHNIVYTYTDGNSCTNKDSTNQVVNAQPTVTLSSFSAVCSNSGLLTLSGGSPSGGTYFGNNISAGKFNPATAGSGTHTINYTYSDGNSCSDTASKTIVVNASPTVTFSALSDVCIDNGLVTLSGGSPTPGTYSGTGVSGTSFNPATAGVGTHTLTYKHTDGNSCSDSATQTIKVNALPTVSMSTLSPVCINQPSFTLSGGTPSGGTYSGTGVSSNSFSPGTAGVGTHNIVYTYTDGNSCTNKDSTNQVVNAQPTVTLSSFSAVCSNSGLLTLSGGSPSGGTYFGNNISAGKFNPATAGSGTHTINYTYSDGNSCSDTASKTIVVNASPTVTFSALSDVCIDNGLVTLSGGSPTPGTYSGTGVSGTSFNPATAGVGTHTLTYKHTDGNSCSDSATQTIKVNALPTVSMSTLSPVCINQPSFTLSGGTPSGGTYSGTGVSSNSFSSGTAGVGTHNIVYTYTDGNSCTNKDSTNQVVNAQPTVTLSSFSAVCSNSGLLTLSGGSPSGGTYFGNNISTGSFNPLIAGGGTHTINYQYTNGNGCKDTASQSIVVNSSPTVSLSSFSNLCANSDSITLTGGVPSSGSYKINGSVVTGFNPATYGKGNHTIWYSFTDGNSCTDSASQIQTVDSVTPLTYPSLASICNGVNPVAINTATPSGGVYSGLGVVSSTMFDPSVTGIGTFQIKYLFTNGFGCKDSVFQSIGVDTLPTVSFQFAQDSICSNADSILLTGSPTGGTFSGTGISGNYFNPALTTAGWASITYTFTGANGCPNTAVDSIRVDSTPTIVFNMPDSICLNASILNLQNYSSPWGGVYSGNGVVSNNYNPSIAGAGLDTVKYVFFNAFGCGDSLSDVIRVDSVPNVSLSSFSSICSADSLILNHGMPSGGVYSGIGVVGNVFKPSTGGMYKIGYRYTNLFGCTDSVLDSIQVNTSPQASLSSLGTICANSSDFTLKNGLPSGGTYIGSMIKQDSIFSPKKVGAGVFQLKYGVIATNGCTDTTSLMVTVDTVPIVSFGTFPILCLGSSNYKLVEGMPSGGKYYGTGVVQDTLFDLSTGAGSHAIKYVYSDLKGCTDSSSSTLKIDTLLKVKSAGFNDVCAYGDTLKLTGGLPLGGKYDGTGVLTGSHFISESARVGNNVLYYVLENKCGKDSMSFSFKVNALPSVGLAKLPSLCQHNGDYKLTEGTPVGGKYYVFSSESSFISTIYSGKVSLKYKYEDSKGCINSDIQSVNIRSKPLVQIEGPHTVCSTDSMRLSSDSEFKSYAWNGKLGDASYSMSSREMSYGANHVSLQVVDDYGCSATTTKRVEVYNCGDPIQMWPNPSNGNFQLQFLSKIDQEIKITISNDVGQEVLRATPYLNPGNNIYDIVLSVGAGIYVVKIEMEGETHLQKIVIR